MPRLVQPSEIKEFEDSPGLTSSLLRKSHRSTPTFSRQLRCFDPEPISPRFTVPKRRLLRQTASRRVGEGCGANYPRSALKSPAPFNAPSVRPRQRGAVGRGRSFANLEPTAARGRERASSARTRAYRLRRRGANPKSNPHAPPAGEHLQPDRWQCAQRTVPVRIRAAAEK